jgi:hypothetical protein
MREKEYVIVVTAPYGGTFEVLNCSTRGHAEEQARKMKTDDPDYQFSVKERFA